MSKEKKIKNIVFDMGFVLIDFRWREYMADLGFSKEETEFLGEKMVMSDFWHALDAGYEEQSEGAAHFKKLYPEYAEKIDAFWSNLTDIAREYPYSEGLVRSLKEQGYSVYLLSNYPKEMAEDHWGKAGCVKLVDGYIISALEHITKPDPRIYHRLESKFGIDLSESVFIDDREDNCEAAKKEGMEAIQFVGLSELKESFLQYDIKIS